MHEASCAFIAAGGNRHPAAADVDSQSGLVAFGADRNIALWRPCGGRSNLKGIEELLCGHTDIVNAVKFVYLGEDRGSILLSGSADAKVRVWRRSTFLQRFTCCKTLDNHEKSINTIGALSKHNLFISGAVDSQLKVWRYGLTGNDVQVNLLQTIALTPKYFPLCLALASVPATNSVVLAVAGSKTHVQIFISHQNGDNFHLVASLTGHEGWIRSLDFCEVNETPKDSTKDLLLATGSQDKYIRLWRLHRGEVLPAVSTSTHDSYMGTLGASLSNKAYRFDTGDTTYSITFEALLIGHEDWIYSTRWHKNGDALRLLSASADNSLAIWQPDTESGVWTCTVRLGEINAQKGATTATGSTGGFWVGLWHDEGRALLSLGRTGSWRLWAYDNEQDVWNQRPAISGHTREVASMAWSKDGSYLLSTSADQTTRMFACVNQLDSQTWHEIARPQIHGYDLNCIDSINNSQFISGADEKLLRVFDEPRAVASLLSELCGVESVTTGYMPDAANIPVLGLSNKVVDFQEDGTEHVSDDTRDNEEADMPNPDGIFVSGFNGPPLEDQLARHLLWPETEKLYGHGYEICAVTASNDGSVVATACRASSVDHAVIRLFRTSDWREIKPALTGHSLTVTQLEFSPDDLFLLSVGRDRQCALFARDAKEPSMYTLAVSDPKAHTRMLLGASWAPQEAGRVFATAGRDKNIHVWNFWDGKLIKSTSISAPAPITAISFLPRLVNEMLVLGYGLDDGTVCLSRISKATLTRSGRDYTMDAHLLPSKSVTRLAWKPIEKICSNNIHQLAIASEDSSVRILSIDVVKVLESA